MVCKCKLIGEFVLCVFCFFQPNIFVSMDKVRLQDYHRYQKDRWVGPLYYDHPDGEDLPGKLSFCGQMGLIIFAPIGIMKAYIEPPIPTSQMGRVVRVLNAVVPGVGMGLAFAATTYYATRIRQKDDFLNHCLGGLAAGTVLGAATGLRYGIAASVLLSGLAAAIKQNDFTHPPHPKRHFSPYIMRKKDILGYPDRGDNWVKAPAPQN